jgi:hypothetical protein
MTKQERSYSGNFESDKAVEIKLMPYDQFYCGSTPTNLVGSPIFRPGKLEISTFEELRSRKIL